MRFCCCFGLRASGGTWHRSGMVYSKAAELLAHATGGAGGEPSGWSKAASSHAIVACDVRLDFDRLLLMISGADSAGGHAEQGDGPVDLHGQRRQRQLGTQHAGRARWNRSLHREPDDVRALTCVLAAGAQPPCPSLSCHSVLPDSRFTLFWRQRVPAYFWTMSDGPYPVHVPRGRSVRFANGNALFHLASHFHENVFTHFSLLMIRVKNRRSSVNKWLTFGEIWVRTGTPLAMGVVPGTVSKCSMRRPTVSARRPAETLGICRWVWPARCTLVRALTPFTRAPPPPFLGSPRPPVDRSTCAGCTDGPTAAVHTAETAHIQGVDLWSEEQSRLTAAMEFHSSWILTKAAGATEPVPHYSKHKGQSSRRFACVH